MMYAVGVAFMLPNCYTISAGLTMPIGEGSPLSAHEIPRHCANSPGLGQHLLGGIDIIKINKSSAPRSLDKRHIAIEIEKEAELLAALRIAKEQLGEDHQLYRDAMRALRSNELRLGKMAGLKRDDLTIEAFGPYAGLSLSERKAAWRKDHPGAVQAHQRNRRARLHGNGGVHTAEDIQGQYDRQRGKCFYCGCDVGDEYHVDHVVPLAKGGSNGIENLVVACPACNRTKHDKHPMDFCGRLL